MTDYNELLKRLEAADTVAYGHYGDGTYAREDHGLAKQAATAIRTLLAERQAGPVRYVKPVDAPPGTWAMETAGSDHDAPTPDRWNEAIEAAAKERAAIVAWLNGPRRNPNGSLCRTPRAIRIAIERGDHLQAIRALKQTEGER